MFGIASVAEMLMFYPAGKVMDRFGRQWVAIPSMVIMGISFVLMPLTTSIVPLTIVSMVMGLANGVGSGIVMTLGAASPAAPLLGDRDMNCLVISLRAGSIRRKQEVLGINFAEEITALGTPRGASCACGKYGYKQRRE